MSGEKSISDEQLRAIERSLDAGEVPDIDLIESEEMWETALRSDSQNNSLSRAEFDDLQREFLTLGTRVPEPESGGCDGFDVHLRKGDTAVFGVFSYEHNIHLQDKTSDHDTAYARLIGIPAGNQYLPVVLCVPYRAREAAAVFETLERNINQANREIGNERVVADGGVPAEQQCTMPSCDETATELGRGGLCEAHQPDTTDNNDEDGAGEGHRASDVSDEAGNPERDTDESTTDDDSSADGQPEDRSDGNTIDLADAPMVEHDVYPADRSEAWHAWKPTDDGRKVPRAPWLNPEWPDKFVSAQNPEVWTNRETVVKWCEHLSGYGLAVNIRDREEYPEEDAVLIDFDNARNPETDRIHPVVRRLIERAGSYADVSTSGTGVHILLRAPQGLPDGVKAIDAALSEHSEFPDAEIEVYDSGRFIAMTGEHIRGTPREMTDAQEFVNELADEYATVAAGTPDAVTREPEKSPEQLAEVEMTTEIQDVFDAIQHTGPRDIRLRSKVTHERADSKSLDPAYRDSESGTGLAEVDSGWIDRKGMHGLDAVQLVALEERLIQRPDQYPTGETFWKAVEALRERGAHIPEFEPPAPSERKQYSAEQCVPPVRDPEEFDREQRWDDFQGERYQDWLDHNRTAMVWGDNAGAGKTTNAALAAAARDRPHTVLFDKHEKAREFITDPATPDDYFHLKGGEQPREECCMDAAAAADEGETPHCPEHGHPADWPRMCPVYQRGKDDPLRQAYETLVPAVGPRKAHHLLGLCNDDEHTWHSEECPWLEQFDALESRARVVGVHEYQTLKTAVGDRDLILDESPRLLANDRRVTVEGLTRAANRLDDLDAVAGTPDGLGAFAAFARRLLDALVADDPMPLNEITPPDLDDGWESYREVKDPLSGAYVSHDMKGETLAKIKIEYNESTVRRIQNDDWNGEPFCMDGLLAAAAEAGLDAAACREAIGIPSTLDECPWCGSSVTAVEGARCCASDDCDWHEEHHTITREGGPQARATGWIEADPDDLDAGQSVGVCAKLLPPASAFPEPLILDATATPEKVAGLYGQPLTDVDVAGDEPLDLDGKLHLTQVVGGSHGDDDTHRIGGQYHAGTIKQSESVQRRIQSSIDTLCERHERPLFGIQKKLIPLFEWPGVEGEDYELLHYGGARGLNRAECDAVCCIGAPHPDMADIERQATLLAQDHPDLRVGGVEYSTRREDGTLAAQPPVYRKLYYEDDNGDSLAVPTKAFSGLVGVLFREAREKELEQFIHRIRPLLVGEDDEDDEELKHAYLLTDAPTAVPVDEVVGFEELADPLSALLPVPEGAVDLLRVGRDALAGDGPDGFRADNLVEECDDGTLVNKVAGWHRLAQANSMDVTERTIRNWIDALESAGLLSAAESYEKRRGVSYSADISTLKSALRVLSSNAGFEVAAVRRLATKIRASDGTLEWLEWAEGVFDLSGNRCGWDPPPNPSG